MQVPEAIDWQNSESVCTLPGCLLTSVQQDAQRRRFAQVQALYWPAVERLIKEHTGASRVVNFDHTRR